jgi:DNA-binding NarL/FixJ family response regulator
MIRVLLADDHAIVRAGLRELLADTGDIVVAGEATDGRSVIERVRERDYDVAVLDLSMPGRNGIELIRQVRQEKPRLRILVLSMHSEQQYAVRALRAGACGYLTKDSAAEELVAAIRRVAGGGAYVSPETAQRLALDAADPASDAAAHTRLSDREFQVFRMIAAGASVSEIAGRLSLSVKTVSTHKSRIMEKMDLANTAALIRYALDHQLLDDALGVSVPGSPPATGSR